MAGAEDIAFITNFKPYYNSDGASNIKPTDLRANMLLGSL